MGDDNPIDPGKTDGTQKHIPTEDWPDKPTGVFKYGLIVGFALILLGGIPMTISPFNWVVEIFIICTGLSIIFGAFGARAKITVLGETGTLLGVAAIAVIVFILIDQVSDRYVHVRITGDVKARQVKTVELAGDQPYAGGMLRGSDSWDFFIFGGEIKNSTLSLRIEPLGDTGEVYFECIDVRKVSPYLASGKMLTWNYSKKDDRLMDVSTKTLVAKIGCFEDGSFATQEYKQRTKLFEFMSTAFADEGGDTSSAPTGELIKELNSDNQYVRRTARESLATQRASAIDPLLKALLADGASYRTQLGALVALNKIGRSNSQDLAPAKEILTEGDIARILDAANDSDKTMRIYASEFLYLIGDARTIRLALEKMPPAASDGRYNYILILRSSLNEANNTQKGLLL